MWTKFFDLSSGGHEKLGACTIWIEAEKYEAIALFVKIFNRNPCNVTCHYCGQDYSVDECDPEMQPGDWVISSADIERFHSGEDVIATLQNR